MTEVTAELTTGDVLTLIKEQLDWCGPTGRQMGHIVLTRTEAEFLHARVLELIRQQDAHIAEIEGLRNMLHEIEPLFANLCRDSNRVRPETTTLWRRIKAAIGGHSSTAVLVAVVLLGSMQAVEARIECRSSPPDVLAAQWAWRMIENKKCWYQGRRGLEKSALHWRTESGNDDRAATVAQSRDDSTRVLSKDAPGEQTSGELVRGTDSLLRPAEDAPAGAIAVADIDVDRSAKSDRAPPAVPAQPPPPAGLELTGQITIAMLTIAGTCLLCLSWLVRRDAFKL